MCKDVIKKVLQDLQFKYQSLMEFGKGTSHHLCEKELPKGTIIAQVSKGIVCIKNGVQYNLYDASRNNKRCCYGIWTKGN